MENTNTGIEPKAILSDHQFIWDPENILKAMDFLVEYAENTRIILKSDFHTFYNTVFQSIRSGLNNKPCRKIRSKLASENGVVSGEVNNH